VNFLLWLRDAVKREQNKPNRSQPKNLCLLVVFNAPLMMSWLSTFNNSALYSSFKTSEITKKEYLETRCWATAKGLSVWKVTEQGRPMASQADGLLGVDVVLITATELQMAPEDCWVHKFQWHTVLADEGHDYLQGQHNAKPDNISLTLQNWRRLQHHTKSMFVITGTPFVTKISYDFVAMTKSIAKESTRARWGPEYRDDGLETLVQGWMDKVNENDKEEKERQEMLRSNVRNVLARFMLRRDENSKIRGEPVMTDYFALCQNCEEPLIPPNNEECLYREALYTETWGSSDRWTQMRNDIMRCLSYCYRYVQWHQASQRKKRDTWNKYTLEEACRQIRAKTVIEILQEGKRTGNGVILFVQRTFLAEFCLKVFPALIITNDTVM
jgi:hypothetical protein